MATNPGTGLLPQPHDPRDLNFAMIASAPIADWSREYRLPEPPNTNQAGGDCCVGEGSSSYHWQLKRKRFAVRSVFAYIALDYGAYLRDGVKRIAEQGQQLYEEIPDPEPKTMQNMRNRTGLNPTSAIKNKELRYFAATDNIDTIALCVQQYRGALFGITGSWATWGDYTNPQPPHSNQGEWGHALYAMGSHMHDGQKCIIAKSSWCGAQPGHHEHHIKENYFNSGYIFDAWVLVPAKGNNLVTRYIVQKGGKLGVLVSVDGDGIFNDVTYWAKNEAHFEDLKLQYEVPNDAPRIVYP